MSLPSSPGSCTGEHVSALRCCTLPAALSSASHRRYANLCNLAALALLLLPEWQLSSACCQQLVRRFPDLIHLELTLPLSSVHSPVPLAALSQHGCSFEVQLECVPGAPPGSPDQAEELLRLLHELHGLSCIDRLDVEVEQLSEGARSCLAGHTGIKHLVLVLGPPLSPDLAGSFPFVEQLEIFERDSEDDN